MPLLFHDDFESGMDRWEPMDDSTWSIATEEGGNRVLAFTGESGYEPPVRSPRNVALVRDLEVSDFVLEAKLKSTSREYGHRDMCLFYQWQDPAHFYYTHIATEADPHANSIFLVDGEPRTSIASERTGGTTWRNDRYHTVRIVRDTESGTIEVFFDDMETPIMRARDTTFLSGRVGVGAFDDPGRVDDVRVWGRRVEDGRLGESGDGRQGQAGAAEDGRQSEPEDGRRGEAGDGRRGGSEDGRPGETGAAGLSDAEVLERYDGLRVADVSDGMDVIGLRDVGLMSPEIEPLWRDLDDFAHQFAGLATTVRYVPTNRPMPGPMTEEEFNEWSGRWYNEVSSEPFADSLKEGSVVVIDASGDGDTGSVGSFNALFWTSKGARGIVTTGSVRDTDEIIKQEIPVYLDYEERGRGIRPGRNEIESVGRPVEVGGVLVREGDVVVADGDGVIVVPRERAAEVAEAARRVLEGDKAARRALYEELGRPLDSTVDTSASN